GVILLRPAYSEYVAMEHVAARFREDVDGAASQPAVFGGQPAGLHFDLLHEIEVQDLPLGSGIYAGGVQTVDDVVVLGTGRSHERGAVVVRGHARRDPRDRIKIAAHRKLIEHLLTGNNALRRAGR